MRTLIAIDEGSAVPVIVDFVKRHRWAPDARFKIIHVISPLMMDHPMASYPLFLETVQKESLENGRNLVKKVWDDLRKELPDNQIDAEVVEGLPKESILDEAKNWKCDLIVVGSHGRTGLSRFFLGSVSAAIVSHAPCSVMVVRIQQMAEHADESAAGRKDEAVVG